MARPSLVSTVFPLIAFAMGIIIGAYLPPGLLPGTGPDAPPPPTPKEAFNSLWEEITGGPVDADKAGTGTDAPTTNANAPTGTPATTGNGGNGGSPTSADAIAAERERRKQAALAINRQPLQLVGVIDGRTVVVEDGTRSRYRVTLAGVPTADAEVAKQLMRFVLQRVSLDVTESVLDERGRILAVVHVLPSTWTKGDPVPTDTRRSLNAAVIRALQQR